LVLGEIESEGEMRGLRSEKGEEMWRARRAKGNVRERRYKDGDTLE